MVFRTVLGSGTATTHAPPRTSASTSTAGGADASHGLSNAQPSAELATTTATAPHATASMAYVCPSLLRDTATEDA